MHTPLDTAARAIALLDAPTNGQSTSSQDVLSNATYKSALQALRVSLDASDFSLMTTGLLGLHEMIRKDHAAAMHTHTRGIAAIISSRLHADVAVTPVVRAALYENTSITFLYPVALGRRSPFDHAEWLELDPAVVGSMEAPIIELKKLTQHALIRLPGLIASVREMRENGTWTARAKADAFVFAHELLALKDDDAEDAILRNITVAPLGDHMDNPLGTGSFAFDSTEDKDTVIMYWATRLMVLKLCLVLAQAKSCSESIISQRLDKQDLEVEQESLTMCLLMCWRNGFGNVDIFSILWGALMGRKLVRGCNAQVLQQWVMDRHNELLAGWGLGYTYAEADTFAEIFAGGPLEGALWEVALGKSEGMSL